MLRALFAQTDDTSDIENRRVMLQLKNIVKDYTVTSELTVHALKDVSLNFRKSEFVSVLGPSGCGKTTLLNIIGGLDRYTSGDLVVDGKSTTGFKDADWDNYRNRSVGFVFQSYNLIAHMSVLDNVALSLTFAGVSKAERISRAKEALSRVGLADQIHKRPNQLSGGQMQRVAIARAIVGDPSIILADEPTGALDTETGVQVMDLLKEISNDRLVILVTHNGELAERYSTRIVRLLDGNLVDDTCPYTDEELARDCEQTAEQTEAEEEQKSHPKSSKSNGWKRFWFSLGTAFAISFRNLRTKKGRTFLTSFAGSIGIFGIALVLAISGGMGDYVDYMQTEAVGDSSVTIGETAYSVSRILSIMGDMEGVNEEPYPDRQEVVPYERESFHSSTTISEDFIAYLQKMDKSLYNAMNFGYNINMHVLKGNVYLPSWSLYASQMVEEDELIEDNYDVLYKADTSETGYPKDKTEVSLVVNKFNRISPSTLKALNIPYTNEDGSYKAVPFEDIIQQGQYTLVRNNGWYNKVSDSPARFSEIKSSQYGEIDSENKIDIKIISILRPKNDDSTQWLTSGVAYLPELANFLIEDASNSEVGKAQLNAKTYNVLTGAEFKVKVPSPDKPENEQKQIESQYVDALKAIGAFKTPTSIKIYPKSIDSKQLITEYIENWNNTHDENEQVLYLDLTGLALSLMATFIDVVSWVLIAFSAVALIVSTVMIAVITYTSVVERTKEIGVLRSIGARKRDVQQLFNAETAVIGTFAGILGVVFALIVGLLVNVVLGYAFGVTNIAEFTPAIIVGMFALSVFLTVFAGLIPARIAAKRDPVKCLRTE